MSLSESSRGGLFQPVRKFPRFLTRTGIVPFGPFLAVFFTSTSYTLYTMLLPAFVLALACPLSAWAVHLSPVSVAASSSTGSSLLAHELAYPSSLPEPIALDNLATLKLSLQVLDREGGKGVQPHQAGLSFVECVFPHTVHLWSFCWQIPARD